MLQLLQRGFVSKPFSAWYPQVYCLLADIIFVKGGTSVPAFPSLLKC